MDLFLSSTNPENTVFFSANGVMHYQIVTTRSTTHGPNVTNVLRPAAAPEDGIVAEIEWKHRRTPTIIRSPLLSGVGQCIGTTGIGIKAPRYLYKRHRFSPYVISFGDRPKRGVEHNEMTDGHPSSRYFIGDDALEYRWKIVKGVGCKLIRCDSNTEIASSSCSIINEGVFAGEMKQVLRIQPCSIDIDLIVLTFIIMEKKRRERDGYADAQHMAYEEVQGDGDGGGSGEGEAEAEAGVIGEL